MRSYIVFLVFFLVSSNTTQAEARETSLIERTISCGEFTAKAKTTMYVLDALNQYKDQSITIRRRGHPLPVKIDLEQKFSEREDLSGEKALDNIAAFWFCRKSRTGESYLWLAFTCGWDAKSCRETSEWVELYDAAGRNLHLDRMSEAQGDALFRRLGTSHALSDGGYLTARHQILY